MHLIYKTQFLIINSLNLLRTFKTQQLSVLMSKLKKGETLSPSWYYCNKLSHLAQERILHCLDTCTHHLKENNDNKISAKWLNKSSLPKLLVTKLFLFIYHYWKCSNKKLTIHTCLVQIHLNELYEFYIHYYTFCFNSLMVSENIHELSIITG